MKRPEKVKPFQQPKFKVYKPSFSMTVAQRKASVQPVLIAMVSNLAFVRKDSL